MKKKLLILRHVPLSNYFTLLVIILLTPVLYSCFRNDIENNALSVKQAQTSVKQAQTYYEGIRTSPYLAMKPSPLMPKPIIMDPLWQGAFSESDENYEVVEALVKTSPGFGVCTQTSEKKGIESNNLRYMNSITRLVVQRSKEGNMDVFLMTIVGETDYLESKNFELWSNTYLHKDVDFSGFILYQNLAGEWVDGWHYQNGKIDKQVQPGRASEAARTNGTTCTTTYITYQVATGGYQTSWATPSETPGVLPQINVSWTTTYTAYTVPVTTCITVPDNTTPYYPRGGGGGGTGGAGQNDADAKNWENTIFSQNLDKNPCAKAVYATLIQTHTLYNITKGFLGEKPVAHLTWDIGDVVDTEEVAAVTNPNPAEKYHIKITLDKEHLERAGKIKIAATMLHEAIHAEMFRKIESDRGITQNAFPGLWDYYKRYYADNNNADLKGGPYHNMMATHYRAQIISGLKEFDSLNHSSHTPEEYTALSWGGLTKTTDWNNLPVATQNGYKEILSRERSASEGCQ